MSANGTLFKYDTEILEPSDSTDLLCKYGTPTGTAVFDEKLKILTYEAVQRDNTLVRILANISAFHDAKKILVSLTSIKRRYQSLQIDNASQGRYGCAYPSRTCLRAFQCENDPAKCIDDTFLLSSSTLVNSRDVTPLQSWKGSDMKIIPNVFSDDELVFIVREKSTGTVLSVIENFQSGNMTVHKLQNFKDENMKLIKK
jgi:hypothetical protein